MGNSQPTNGNNSIDEENDNQSRLPATDPRSPSDGIDRTPIQFDRTQGHFDPRSPTCGLDRTPVGLVMSMTDNASFLTEADTFEPIDGVALSFNTSELDNSAVSDSVLIMKDANKEKSSKNPIARLRSSFRKLGASPGSRRAGLHDSPKAMMRHKHRLQVTNQQVTSAEDSEVTSSTKQNVITSPQCLGDGDKENLSAAF